MSVQLESAKYLWWGGELEKEWEGWEGGKGQGKDKKRSPSACTHAHRLRVRLRVLIHTYTANTVCHLKAVTPLTVPSRGGARPHRVKGRRRGHLLGEDEFLMKINRQIQTRYVE